MIRRAIIVAILLFTAAPTHAQSFGEDPTLIIRPNSSPDLNLPRTNAEVRLSCAPPTGLGGLTCRVLEERPEGLGYGAAAVRIASRFRAPPRHELPTPGALTVGFQFCYDRTLGCAEAQEFGATPILLEDTTLANIVEGPRLGNLSRHFPRAAWRAGVEGNVNVQCRVSRDAHYEDCVVISEEPLGWGFGAATIALLAESRAPVLTTDGRSLVGRLIMAPVSYRLRN